MEIVGQRKFLRSIAVACGAVSQGKSFPMKADKLVAAILTVTDDSGEQRYPNIASMDDEALQALESELKGAPPVAKTEKAPRKTEAPKKEAKVAPKAEKKAAPKTEKKSAPKAPAKTSAKKAAPTKKAPAKKAPVRRRAAAEDTTPTNGSSGSTDFTLLIEMVKTIGTMVEAQGASVEEIRTAQAEISDIHEKLTSIEQHLCWAYNADVDPGNEISSLSEIDWT